MSQVFRDTDNVYVNVTINNPKPAGLTHIQELIPAKKTVEYDQPLLQDPSKYYATVVKFQASLDEIPLLVMPITTGITTPLVVGVCERPLVASLVPGAAPDFKVTPPLTPGFRSNVAYQTAAWDLSAIYDNGNPYFFVYSYTRFVNMINVALQTAWGLAGSPGGAGFFPYIHYSANEGNFVLNIPYEFLNAASVTGNGWTVFFNHDVTQYLQGFDYSLRTNDPAGQRFEIQTANLAYDKTYIASLPVGSGTIPAAAGTVYSITQDYTSYDYINSIKKIVVTTNTIPVNKEFVPASDGIGDNNFSSGSFNGIGVLTDFQLSFENKPGEQRSIVTYNSDLYRLIDLVSTAPMRKIDLNFYWSDTFGNLYPIYLSRYGSISMKLGFFRKDSIAPKYTYYNSPTD